MILIGQQVLTITVIQNDVELNKLFITELVANFE
jgi:hypothetical protein